MSGGKARVAGVANAPAVPNATTSAKIGTVDVGFEDDSSATKERVWRGCTRFIFVSSPSARATSAAMGGIT
jgi:hypothetical protein